MWFFPEKYFLLEKADFQPGLSHVSLPFTGANLRISHDFVFLTQIGCE